MSTQEQEKTQDTSKVKKGFEDRMQKLVALFGGRDLLARTKLDGDAVTSVVARLVKSKKEAIALEFEQKASALIEKHLEFEKWVKEEKKRMEKAVDDKMKAFSDEADKLFGLVDNMSNIEKEYAKTLSKLSGGGDIPPTEPPAVAAEGAEPTE